MSRCSRLAHGARHISPPRNHSPDRSRAPALPALILALLPILLPILLLVLLPARAAWAGIPLDRIVAVVNDDVIMLSELDKRTDLVLSQLREQNTSLPPRSIVKKQVLEKLVQTRLQVQLAQLNGITISEQALQSTIQRIADENNVSLEEFRQILQEDGHDFYEFLNEVRNEMLISKLRQESIGRRIVITDREIDNMLANQKLQQEIDAEVRLSHILVSAPENPSAEELQESRKIAEQIHEDLLAGADFATLAKRFSDSQTAAQGGDLGWRKISEVPSLFSEYVLDMQEGDLSEVIESPGGFHLIRLSEMRSEERNMIQQVHARHILLRVDALITDEEAESRLRKLLYRIRSGESFGKLAQAYSQDPISALKGGDLDWQEPGFFVPEFAKALESLEKNELSEPFRTAFGWHIVEVLGEREHDNTESVKRNQARIAIFERRMEEEQQRWLRDMRNNAYVELRLEEEPADALPQDSIFGNDN